MKKRKVKWEDNYAKYTLEIRQFFSQGSLKKHLRVSTRSFEEQLRFSFVTESGFLEPFASVTSCQFVLPRIATMRE